MFGYVSKIASRLRAPSIEERELAYLNQSVDRVDLEYRQRHAGCRPVLVINSSSSMRRDKKSISAAARDFILGGCPCA